MTTTTDADDRLRAAGWQLASAFRMTTLPSEVADDELICWRSPAGEVLTEKRALERLDAEEKEE